MVTYPINVRRDNYRGNDARKRQKVIDKNLAATEIERVVNEMLRTQVEPVRSYGWHEIANATGLSMDVVASLGYSIDCGSNGFTAYRHDLGYQKSLEMSELGLRPDLKE
jgi:hypothetical protein